MLTSKRFYKENIPQVEDCIEDTDAQSCISDTSKRDPSSTRNKYYSSRLAALTLANANHQTGERIPIPPAEITAFIERQEEYIEQLERESHYCREELKNLVDKVREVGE